MPLLAALVSAGCSNAPSTTAPLAGDAVAAYEALSIAYNDCKDSKRECRDATDCSEAALQLCDDEYEACKEAARPEEEAMKAAKRACHDEEKACKAAAIDEAGLEACRAQHDICHPPKPKSPCHAALDTCLDAAHAAEEAAPPVMESEPEGCKRGKQRSAAEEACHAENRACMEAERAANPPPPPPQVSEVNQAAQARKAEVDQAGQRVQPLGARRSADSTSTSVASPLRRSGLPASTGQPALAPTGAPKTAAGWAFGGAGGTLLSSGATRPLDEPAAK
jgi:hypothetical protein